MLCKHCNNQISDDANYCAYCGSTQKQSNGVSSIILFISIIIFVYISLVIFLIDEFAPGFWSIKIYISLILVRLPAFILIPFAFNKMKHRLIALGIMTPTLVAVICNEIYFFFNTI